MTFRLRYWAVAAALLTAGAGAGLPASAAARPAAFGGAHVGHAFGGMHGIGAVHSFGGMHVNLGGHGWGRGGWGHGGWNHNWNGNWNFNRNVNINRNSNRNININRNVNWNRNWGHHWRDRRFARWRRWRDGFGRWHWVDAAIFGAIALPAYAGESYGGSYDDEGSYDYPDSAYSSEEYNLESGYGCCDCEGDGNMYGDGQDCGG